MALSDQETLYNLALGYVGDSKVTEGSTDAKQYQICERYYTLARDEVLASHIWNEAKTRTIVMQSTTAPLFGYDYQFPLPSDCVRIVSIGTDKYVVDENGWEVEGSKILTDYYDETPAWVTDTDYVAGQYVSVSDITYLCAVSHTAGVWADDLAGGYWTSQGGDYVTLAIEYISNSTAISNYSARLKNAVAMKLAIKISTEITNDVDTRNMLIQEYEKLVMPQARSVDSQQGKPRTIFPSSEWIRSRSS